MVDSRPRAPWNRCAIYTRQSVTRPDGDEALTSCTLQREACERFAREQGWTVVPERFDDEGESGATMERPALERLVEAIRAEQVGRVVVYRLDRLTRRLADWALLQRVFEHHNVGLTVVHGSLDVSGGPMARFQLNMLATLAELEREMIGERLRDARAARRARGLRSAGRVPLGYVASPETKQLVPVPEEAALVRWAFERAGEGALPATIADEANLRGDLPRPWKGDTVLRMLRNPVYVGRHPDGQPSVHSGIVPLVVFDAAQAAITSRRSEKAAATKPDEKDDLFLLRGLLRCPKCKGGMTTSAHARAAKVTKSTPRYYRCKAHGCFGLHLPAAEVEDRAARYLLRLPAKWDAALRERAVTAALVWEDLWPKYRRAAFWSTFESITWYPKLFRFNARPARV